MSWELCAIHQCWSKNENPIGKRQYNDLADKPTDMIRVECQRDLFWVSTC